MSTMHKDGISRRGFLAGLGAGGAAVILPATGASAMPSTPAAFRPGPATPVRALHGGVPYFDFSGQVPEAKAARARPQKALSELTAEEQYLMGAY